MTSVKSKPNIINQKKVSVVARFIGLFKITAFFSLEQEGQERLTWGLGDSV